MDDKKLKDISVYDYNNIVNDDLSKRSLDINIYPLKLDPPRIDLRPDFDICGQYIPNYIRAKNKNIPIKIQCSLDQKSNQISPIKLRKTTINYSRPKDGTHIPRALQHIDTESMLKNINTIYSKCNIQYEEFKNTLPCAQNVEIRGLAFNNFSRNKFNCYIDIRNNI